MKIWENAPILTELLFVIVKFYYHIIEAICKLLMPASEKSVIGEIVLVTGAGHGIGREVALKYASFGAIVVCWDVNEQENDETVNEIKKLTGTKAYAYKYDVSNREEVFKVAEKVRKEAGNVTILVNNAGIMYNRRFLNYKPEEIKRTFDINVLAHYWTLQAFLPSMIENNYGHVVAVASIAALYGSRNTNPYSASKFAIRGLMESLNEEMRKLTNKGKSININFTTVMPYMVNTGFCKVPKYS